MSETKTRTSTTALGEVQYETVECNSCEQEVMKKEASRFYAGTVRKEKAWRHRGVKEVEFDNRSYHSGWLCPYCLDDDDITQVKVGKFVWDIERNVKQIFLWITFVVALAVYCGFITVVHLL